MSELLTVEQYANQHGVSKQSVYQRIKRSTLNTTTVNGVTMIDTSTNTSDTSPTSNDIQVIIKEVVKPYKQHVKQLKRDLKECKEFHSKEYDRLSELFNLLYSDKQLPAVIDTEIVKKYKKKKNKKKK